MRGMLTAFALIVGGAVVPLSACVWQANAKSLRVSERRAEVTDIAFLTYWGYVAGVLMGVWFG